MARLVVENQDVVVRLSWREALAARRKTVSVPVNAVWEARVEPDWWRSLRGRAERGHSSPGHSAVGTWRHADGLDFVAVRAGSPVAVVDLLPGRAFSRLSVSMPDPDGAVQVVRLAVLAARRAGAAGGEKNAPGAERSAAPGPG